MVCNDNRNSVSTNIISQHIVQSGRVFEFLLIINSVGHCGSVNRPKIIVKSQFCELAGVYKLWFE